MKKEEIVGLAVRLFALYIAISILGNVGKLVAYMRFGTSGDISPGVLVPAIGIPLAVALILWLVPLTIARKLLPVTKAAPKERRPTLAEYQAVAFSVLGMWMLAEHLPAVFSWIGYALYLNANPSASLTEYEYGKLAATVGGIVIGFWLLFGARGFVGLLRNARSAGIH